MTPPSYTSTHAFPVSLYNAPPALHPPSSPGNGMTLIDRPNTRRSIGHHHGRPSGPVSALP